MAIALREIGRIERTLSMLSRRLRGLKSLLSFASKMGYLPFNVGAAIRGPSSSRHSRSGS